MFKKSIVLFGLLASLASSHGIAMVPSLVPDCWTNPDAEPRSYLIAISRSKLGSQKALRALEALSVATYVHPRSFPMFFDKDIYVDMSAPLGQWGDAGRPMTDGEIRVAAESELVKLARDYALKIDCNHYVYPQTR